MQAYIEETATKRLVEAQILSASRQDLPLKKDGWQFNWRELARKNEEAMFFKLVRTEALQEIEGMLMIFLENREMLAMKNIELAPDNIGRKGKFDLVAGCLIAYACYQSQKLAKGNYRGFLIFESKSKLVPLYQKKYGATHAIGQKMFIDDIKGKELIERYLGLSIGEINL